MSYVGTLAPDLTRKRLDESIRDLRMEYKLTRYWLSMGKTTLKSRVKQLGKELKALELTVPRQFIASLTYWQTDAVLQEFETRDAVKDFLNMVANPDGHRMTWRDGDVYTTSPNDLNGRGITDDMIKDLDWNDWEDTDD